LPKLAANSSCTSARFFQWNDFGRVAITNNTATSDGTLQCGATYTGIAELDNPSEGEAVYHSNIANYGYAGMYNMFDGTGASYQSVVAAWPYGQNFAKNVFINDQGYTVGGVKATVINFSSQRDPGDQNTHPWTPVMTCPNSSETLGGCYYLDNYTGLFQDKTNNDYTVVLSALANYGFNGRVVGADISKVNNSQLGTVNGNNNPYFDFRLSINPGATTATLYYHSPDNGNCTTTVSKFYDYGSPVFTNTSSGLDRERTENITGLTANTRNYLKVVCGTYQRDLIFLTSR
jgi:hypothetical protein